MVNDVFSKSITGIAKCFSSFLATKIEALRKILAPRIHCFVFPAQQILHVLRSVPNRPGFVFVMPPPPPLFLYSIPRGETATHPIFSEGDDGSALGKLVKSSLALSRGANFPLFFPEGNARELKAPYFILFSALEEKGRAGISWQKNGREPEVSVHLFYIQCFMFLTSPIVKRWVEPRDLVRNSIGRTGEKECSKRKRPIYPFPPGPFRSHLPLSLSLSLTFSPFRFSSL